MVVEGKRRAPAKEAPRASPTPNVNKIASLKRYADKDYALDLLHQVTRAVAPIIHKYKFRVGTLCEMFPKNANLLGLNVNRGQKILIRLRAAHNDRSFFPIGDLIGTFLHELAHNVHGPHDAKFYALLDELKTMYETNAYLNSDYVCEENKLGLGYVAPWADPQSVRQKRLQALSRGTYKAESRRLGGKKPPIKDLKRLMLQAAERRLLDSKWCAGSSEQALSSDLEELHSGTLERGELREVIDLTADQTDDNGVEIITVDACEADATSKRKDSLGESLQNFANLASLGDIPDEATQLFVSCSAGKTFIGDGWRRKIVVNMDFDNLINQELRRCLRSPSPKMTEAENVSPGTSTGKVRAKKLAKSTGKKCPGGNAMPGPTNNDRPKTKIAKKRGKSPTKRSSRKETRSKSRKEVRCISFEDLFAD